MRFSDDGMKVTVQKDRLLATLRENREQHEAEVAKAQERYRKEAILAMRINLRKAEDGGKIETYIRLPEPTSYVSSYDKAIAMVEWQVGETVELSQSQFQQYVLGEWDWKAEFAATTGTYLG